MEGLRAVSFCGDEATTQEIAQALAARYGAILRFSTALLELLHYVAECHVSIDITNAGGNMELMTQQ